MLKLVPNPFFRANANIEVAGEPKAKVVRIHYKYLEKERLQEYLKSLPERSDEDSLKEIVVGWETADGVTSEGESYEGIEVEFSEENLKALLSAYPMAPLGLFTSFQAEVFKAKVGN